MAKNKKILLIVGAIVLLVVIATICLFAFRDKEKATYIVTFNSDGGSAIPEQNIEEGMSATKPQDPEKEGYIFIEWLLDEESYDFNNIVDKNIELSAKWEEIIPEKEMVTIKFNSDGGTTIANEVIEKGNKMQKPTDPVKDGHTFVEWTLNGNTFDFETEVSENLELVAKWEENKVTNEQQNTNKPTTNTENNNTASNNSGGNNSGNTTPSTPVPTPEPTPVPEPTPQPEPTPTVKKYTVTFNSNGGSAVASQTITEGGKATKPANPSRSGYTFVEWTLNGSAYNFNSSVNSNITLVAKWKEVVKKNYTVTFNSNGGSAVSSQTVVEGNKATKPSNPTREGYNFAGWTLNGSAYDFNSAVTGNITLVAKWKQKTYTIKISAVDDYSPARVLSVYENGSKITVREIRYSDGTYLCSGSNPNVNKNVIAGETSFIVVLSDGTQVTARIS